MAVFEALSVGSFVSGLKGEGEIVSVYSGAVNILLPGGYLCSLLKEKSQMSDLGITVPGLFAGDACTALKGSGVVFSGGVLDISGGIRIVYGAAEQWSGEVSPCGDPVPLKELVEAYGRLAVPDGLSPVITGRGHNIYSRTALSRLDKAPDGGCAGLPSLVGLGIGFTPSGDDFITGALLWADVFSGSDRKICRIDRSRISGDITKTTYGGRTLLHLALKRSYPFYLKEFISGLCEKNINIDEILTYSLAHGATSGSDAVAGFLWAALRL